MHDFELDSTCYFLWMSSEWWKASGRTDIFDEEWLESAYLVLNMWIVETDHGNELPH